MRHLGEMGAVGENKPYSALPGQMATRPNSKSPPAEIEVNAPAECPKMPHLEVLVSAACAACTFWGGDFWNDISDIRHVAKVGVRRLGRDGEP